MKQRILLFLSLVLIVHLAFSQNPSMGVIEDDTIIVNSGNNIILLPNIDDGDAGVDQDITFTVNSDSPDTVSVGTVEYDKTQTFAILNITEHGLTGTSTIDVTIDDGDNTASQSFDVMVGNYHKPGINYQVYDIVFWKEALPFGSNPLFDSIFEETHVVSSSLDWDKIDPSVSNDCGGGLCDGHDFTTTMLIGYIVPPTTGNYTFYQKHSADDAVWLSMDADYDNADPIIYNGDNNSVGTESSGEWASDPVSLTAGKVYAMYSVHWNVHQENVDLKWEGPGGLSKDYIDAQYLMYVYDTVKPEVPGNLNLLTRATDFIRVDWDPATDNKELAGYNIYVDGNKINTSLLTDTLMKITGLSAETKYSVAVKAVDDMGNESGLSNIVTTTTYGTDATPPSAPTTLNVIEQTGMALKINWTGAVDNETGVIGYNVYIDGNPYNVGDYIYDTVTILKVLQPETDYTITIEAINAVTDTSNISTGFPVSTSEFDPSSAYLGVHTGRAEVVMENLSWNYGLGANPNYRTTELFSTYKTLLQDLHAGTVRWGALTANPLSFSSNINTNTSIGDFMNLCNELDAYTTFTCGVSSTADWRNNSTVFLNFLEYINGPSGTTYGDIREGEGYGPLLDDSKGLIFEFGNEVWGFGAHNADFSNYEEYGDWCREMAAVMRTSPYWDEDKITLVYSGRNPHPSDSYGLHNDLLEGDTGDIDWLAVSGYLGPIKDYETNLEYYKNTIAAAARDMEGLEKTMESSLSITGDIKATYFYEGNVTTSSYNGRLGQAIIFTDYCLGAFERANAIPTIFHLTGGQWRITDPTDGYKRLPMFLTSKFFNMHCRGHVMKTNYSTQNTITDSDGSVVDWEPVGVYAYTDSVNFSVVLLSRDFENTHYVQVDLPDGFNYDAPSGRKYVISGNDFDTKDATIDSADFTMNDSLIFEVPPYSMVLVTFTGDDQNFEQLPLAYFDDYVKATNIEISCLENTHTITENGGRLHLASSISPSDAFVNTTIWEVIGADSDVMFSGGIFMAPSTGNVNDTVIVKATSGDREVSDTFAIYIKIGVGIEENKDENEQICIYPNPVNNKLTLSTDGNKSGTVSIINAQGSTIKSFVIDKPETTIDVSALGKGIYFIKMQTDENEIITRKFIKE